MINEDCGDHICKVTDFKMVFNKPGIVKCKICGRTLNRPKLIDIILNKIEKD